ncbi:hypothetical protein P378_03630 [Desulforamulus profundi]|uniref:4Fe-4S ferredoxin-type domain-containing protein n=1 Tax=Desulforamulus profundi TaxID=1383067 RepID=A0A2C6MIM1_9FIRM|nr:hypothetical protein [Desulforamulus profundi]PHJ39383.1 hypothetical protein P378_03630 [Desulforamulus profundi]
MHRLRQLRGCLPGQSRRRLQPGLGKRKAIYKLYAQAFPNAYAIDSSKCLKFKNLNNEKLCGKCLKACQAGAINHHMQDEEIQIEVGSILLVPGFETFDPAQLALYKYGELKNVVTSLEFERILSASGPFGGHLVRPSDHKEPAKIAWIQCVAPVTAGSTMATAPRYAVCMPSNNPSSPKNMLTTT